MKPRVILYAALLAASGQALAFCPAPARTGNPTYDNFAQQQFYACLNQQRNAPQVPAVSTPNAAGQINFKGLDTNTPAQIGASTASSIAALRRQQMQREQQQLQNEMMRLQIEQMQRQMNQQ